MNNKARIERLRALGILDASILGVLEMIDDELADARRPRTQAERSKAYRDAHRNENVTETLRTRCEPVAETLRNRSEDVAPAQPLACAFSIGEEVDRYTPENATHSSPKGEKIKSETPVSHLSPIVGPDLAAELVDHRKRMRRPMTAGSARRLAAKLSEVDDPSAAARLMIDRGWQGFEPEWVTNPKAIGARAGPINGHAPPRPAPLSPRMQALSDIANEQPDHHDEQTYAPASDPDASGGAIRAIGWARRAG